MIVPGAIMIPPRAFWREWWAAIVAWYHAMHSERSAIQRRAVRVLEEFDRIEKRLDT